MTVTSAKLSSRSIGVRTFFARQLMLVMVSAALFAILWVANVRGPGMGLLPIILYGLFIGNLTTPMMNRLSPLSSRLSFPWNWIAYLLLLFLTAVVIASLTVAIIMPVYRIPSSSFFSQLWSAGRLVVVVVLIVGSIRHLHEESQEHLEGKNLELQRAVEMGNTRSKQQEQELAKAREIQEGLLPKKIPQVKGLDVTGAWQPASTVGGDYFDVLKFSEKKIGVCIGDVVGKGISAALLMANLQASFRAFASEEVSPGTLVRKLNEVISTNIAPDKFVTFWYCTIDINENRLTYASAGHWPPILFHNTGEGIPLREVGGTPLGILPDWNYEEEVFPLSSGDRLVLYTDGLTEVMNTDEQEFGEGRLLQLCSSNIALSASELLAAIRKEVVSFCNGNFQDDFTLVVVAVK
jgi:sigma-B regulation protein RsbU (phosphoserine phosphatase)